MLPLSIQITETSVLTKRHGRTHLPTPTLALDHKHHQKQFNTVTKITLLGACTITVGMFSTDS